MVNMLDFPQLACTAWPSLSDGAWHALPLMALLQFVSVQHCSRSVMALRIHVYDVALCDIAYLLPLLFTPLYTY